MWPAQSNMYWIGKGMRNSLSDCHKLFSAFFPQIPIGHCCEYRAVLGVWCSTQLAVVQNIQYAEAMHWSTACQKIVRLHIHDLTHTFVIIVWRAGILSSPPLTQFSGSPGSYSQIIFALSTAAILVIRFMHVTTARLIMWKKHLYVVKVSRKER